MSLIDELEKIIAQEQAELAEGDHPEKRVDQGKRTGIVASLVASYREWKASPEGRPRP
jgi:hypothetical protein